MKVLYSARWWRTSLQNCLEAFLRRFQGRRRGLGSLLHPVWGVRKGRSGMVPEAQFSSSGKLGVPLGEHPKVLWEGLIHCWTWDTASWRRAWRAISMTEEKWEQVTSRGNRIMPRRRTWGKNSHPVSILGSFHSSILASAKLTDQIGAVVPSH